MSGETGSSATRRAHLWGIPTGRRPEPEDVTGLWSADRVETGRIASGCRHVLRGATRKACLRSPPQRPWPERRTSLPWVATPRKESMQTKPCAVVFREAPRRREAFLWRAKTIYREGKTPRHLAQDTASLRRLRFYYLVNPMCGFFEARARPSIRVSATRYRVPGAWYRAPHPVRRRRPDTEDRARYLAPGTCT
jgi:hypothetical protein